MTDVNDNLATLAKEFKNAHDEVKGLGSELQEKFARGEKTSQDLKDSVDKALTEFNGLKARLDDAEQKLARGGGAEEVRQKSMGEQFVESKGFESFRERGAQGSVKVEVKTVTSANAGGLIRPLYETEPVSLPKRRFTIRDLLPVVPITTSSVDYPKQTTRTNNAAPVAEGAAKPYSDYAWSNATAPVRTIAHLAKITRQAMDDAPRLIAEIDAELRYGLGLVEEDQILNGDGTGQNLTGIIPQATAYSAIAGVVSGTATRVDMIRLAMLQAAVALWPADGIVVNLADWAAIELQKTTDGGYLFANPQGQVEPRLWGLPVVDTPAMAIDKFLVGSFKMGATLYDRMGVEVLISTENVDDFEKNLATMRAEERIALAVKRPASFVYGDFGAVA